MPYTENNSIITSLNFSGDVTGSIGQMKVTSVQNVSEGILSASNGGTGINYVVQGALLIGENNTNLTYIQGNDGDILKFVSGSWTTEPQQILNIELETSGNNLFDIDYSIVSGTKTYSLNFIEKTGSVFLGTDISGGIPDFKQILNEDLPQTIENKLFSGSFEGNANLNGFFSGTFIGDGSGIENLQVSQITDLTQSIQDQISVINTLNLVNLNTNNMSASNVDIFDGVISGSFFGDGSKLFNISASIITGLDPVISQSVNVILDDAGLLSLQIPSFIPSNSINVSSSGSVFSFELGSEISASTINSNFISGNTVIGNVYGSFTGDGSSVENLDIENLNKNFIKINGIDVKLGEAISISTVNNFFGSDNIDIVYDTSSLDSLTIELTDDIFINNLQVSNNINTNTLSASFISSSNIISPFISSSGFIGDGSGLDNIRLENISDLQNTILSLIKTDDQNITLSNGEITLKDNIVVSTASINNLTIQSASVDTLQVNNLYLTDINVSGVTADAIYSPNFVSASMFYGDGSQLKNISFLNLLDQPSYSEYGFANKFELETTASNLETSIDNLYDITEGLYNIISDSAITSSNYLNINIGDVVYLSGSTLKKANNLYKESSKVFGYVININSNIATVKKSGRIALNLSNYNLGEYLYLNNSASFCRYDELMIGNYAVQVGQVLDQNTLVLDIKKLWKIN